jgi:hypothetical protein
MGCSISLLGFLAILFFILKVAGAITWPWLWVLAPLWIGAIVAIITLVIIVILILNMDG